MEIRISGHDVYLTEDIKKYANKKMRKVSRYYKNIIGIDLTLEEMQHRKDNNTAKAKALVKIPGNDVSAQAEGKNVFAAIDELEGKLRMQLIKSKTKRGIIKNNWQKSQKAFRKILRK